MIPSRHADTDAALPSPTPSPTPGSPPATTRRVPAQRTRDLTAAALVTALLAASAWISIPLGPVPITLQVFVVVLASLLLRPGWAAAALGVYLAMGAAGLPVFSNGTGGLGVLAGPTGGYLIGFFVAAPLGALFRLALQARGVAQSMADAVAVVIGIAVIYLLGWMQLSLVTNMAPVAAFIAGVAPFLVPDAIKGAVAITVAIAVRRARSGVQV